MDTDFGSVFGDVIEVELESAELSLVLVEPGEVDEPSSVAVVLDGVALPDEFTFAVRGLGDFDLPGVLVGEDVAELFVDEGDSDGEVVEMGGGILDRDS